MTEMENSVKNDVPVERCTAPDNLALPSTIVEDHLQPLYSVEVESTPCDWLATSQILLEESNMEPYNEVLLQVSEQYQVNEDEEIIEKLLDKGFSHFTRAEKLEIIKCRPTPSLRLNCAHKYKTARNFHVRWYDKFKWLCGSAKKDKMYCWPCLLFSNVRYHKNWNELGQNNLTNIHTSFRQHESSKSHIVAYMKMLKFNRVKYEFRMDAPFCENADSYNEIVKKNRYIIKCLVDTICSDRLQSLIRLDNCNNCAQLLSELAKNDCKLRDYLNSTNILVNLTDKILCDIITSISKAIFVKIKYELEDTRYCALFIERIEDKNENVYLIIICRFINKLRIVQHRLISFLEVSKYPYSNDLLQAFLIIIHDLGCCEKLISIAYDRSLFSRDFTNQFEIAIRKLCKHVLLIDYTPPNAAINVFNSIKSTKAGRSLSRGLSNLSLQTSWSTPRLCTEGCPWIGHKFRAACC
ncbi:uncharacterized protein isoform X2 [Rhodnius prolixus]|uniref:uncharacterized protein isoform X2 n=1 Tax=Rhodnius prolixus TaxID=13249 RepID=UPI003D18A929